MSHATGEVIALDRHNTLAYFEYNGTSDVAISCLHATLASMRAEWRSHEWRNCYCGNYPLPAFLYTNYGDGFYWPALVCLSCGAIVSNLAPFRAEQFGDCGHSLRSYHNCDDPACWPKDGHPIRDADAHVTVAPRMLA